MKPPFFCSLLTAALLLQAPVGQAQKLPKKLDALATQYAKAGQFNGTVLVADHGKVVFTKGYGLANREWNQPNAADIKFRLGSLTKQFTALLVMQLVEKGQLKLDVPISTYLPDYARASGDKITLHHLLTHTSGIPNYTSKSQFQTFNTQHINPLTAVSIFATLPLEFEPGSTYHYSNSGYFLLGAIIEKLTGKPYAQVLSENILLPLHMQDSGYDLSETVLSRRAAGYEKTANGSLVNTSYIDMSGPYAAGSMYSTVVDLYKWDQALYTNQLLNDASKALLFKPFRSDYAYGWTAVKRLAGSDSVSILRHAGVINGFRTFMLRVPKDQQLVVVLDNESNEYTPKISSELLQVLHHGHPVGPEPAARKPVAVDAATVAPYVGRYQLSPTFFITVTAAGNQLSAQATGQSPFVLVATAPARFTVQGVPAEVEFVKNANGAVEKLILHQGGHDSPGAKVE